MPTTLSTRTSRYCPRSLHTTHYTHYTRTHTHFSYYQCILIRMALLCGIVATQPQPHSVVWNKSRSIAKITDFSVSSVVVRSKDTDQTQSEYIYKTHIYIYIYIYIYFWNQHKALFMELPFFSLHLITLMKACVSQSRWRHWFRRYRIWLQSGLRPCVLHHLQLSTIEQTFTLLVTMTSS